MAWQFTVDRFDPKHNLLLRERFGADILNCRDDHRLGKILWLFSAVTVQ